MAEERQQLEENLVLEEDPARSDAGGDRPPGESGGRAAGDSGAQPLAESGHQAGAKSGEQAGADSREQAHQADEDALRGDVDELVAAAAQRDEYLALAQRTQADFENYRKRVAKESAAAQERGVAKLAKELLPALDNLDRALDEGAAADGQGSEDALLAGVRLVRSELHAALSRLGIERFSPKNEAFDPAQHEAMAQQPAEGVGSGTVSEVLQPGYRLGDSIIRPARVIVAA